jgi:hypothetical protein
MSNINININIVTVENKYVLSVDKTKKLNDYKELITENMNCNINSHLIKSMKYGTIDWDFLIEKLEEDNTIYLVHTIR